MSTCSSADGVFFGDTLDLLYGLDLGEASRLHVLPGLVRNFVHGLVTANGPALTGAAGPGNSNSARHSSRPAASGAALS